MLLYHTDLIKLNPIHAQKTQKISWGNYLGAAFQAFVEKEKGYKGNNCFKRKYSTSQDVAFLEAYLWPPPNLSLGKEVLSTA